MTAAVAVKVGTPAVVHLVDQARAGDLAAFGELYRTYQDTVYRYAYNRTGSAPLAEDISQEVFVRALRRIHTFTWQGRDVGAWLVTIARNLVADYYKSHTYRRCAPYADPVAPTHVDAAPGPEHLAIRCVDAQFVVDAVRGLSDDQRRCLTLRFWAGLSIAETAAAMGKKDGAIKALQYRAVRAAGLLLAESRGAPWTG